MHFTEEMILNVTLLEPKRKHPAIFEQFDGLVEGESMIILNDHDPKPLYYQFLAERGSVFNWEYLEKGPDWWRVRILKRKDSKNEESIGEIASKDIRKIEVFRKYGIDFCCGGKKNLEEVCLAKGLDASAVKRELETTNFESKNTALPYHEWALDFLIDFIINTHHVYVSKQLPLLLELAVKVSSVHHLKHPELKSIEKLIGLLHAELSAHLQKEERVLFPYIKTLVRCEKQSVIPEIPGFETVNTPIHIMEMEHELAGEILAEIKDLSKGFKIPEDACNSYKYLYQMIQEFEQDLNVHIHLENNILFLKSAALEKKLLKIM